MLTVAAGLVLGAGLFGCDENPNSSASAPVVAAAKSPACTCQAKAAPATVAEAQPARVHRHRNWRHRSGVYEAAWDSRASSVTSYSSHESGYVSSDSDAAYPPPPPPSGPPAKAWIDGYGRGHHAAGAMAQEADSNPGLVSVEDSRRRFDVWRGFNSKCRNAID
jgi:hypothetical protein